MKHKLPVLNINMFGRMRMTYGHKPILFYKNPGTITAKLVAILLFHGIEGIERNNLLEELYGHKKIVDMKNNLRVTIHRLKKALIKAGLPDHDYILVKDGIYYWSSPMETVVDVVRFRELTDQAQDISDPAQKAVLLKEALELYNGEFLQEFSGEDWVLLEAVRFKNRYTDALSQMCEYLKEQGEYEELLKLCEPACQLYPFDEWQSVKMDCYSALGRYQDALKEYEDTAKLFFEELGINPSEAMLNRLSKLSNHMGGRHLTLNEIKGQLKEPDEDGAGAFYCSMPSFRDEYRLMSRVMERSGQSIYLMLCTITDGKGHPQEKEDRLRAMTGPLHNAIKNCLRRCDSFTRCSPGQFLILLMGTNSESCEIACSHIGRQFSREHKSWGNCLSWHVSLVSDMDYAPEKHRFIKQKKGRYRKRKARRCKLRPNIRLADPAAGCHYGVGVRRNRKN